MEKQRLQETLNELHTQLSRSDVRSFDADTQAMLQQVTEDIEDVLNPQQETPPEETGAISSRIDDLVLQFEVDHPHLTRALNQVAAALSNLGI